MDQIKFFEKLVDLVRERKIALNYISQHAELEFSTGYSNGKFTSIPTYPASLILDISITITDNVLKDEIMGIING